MIGWIVVWCMNRRRAQSNSIQKEYSDGALRCAHYSAFKHFHISLLFCKQITDLPSSTQSWFKGQKGTEKRDAPDAVHAPPFLRKHDAQNASPFHVSETKPGRERCPICLLRLIDPYSPRRCHIRSQTPPHIIRDARSVQ